MSQLRTVGDSTANKPGLAQDADVDFELDINEGPRAEDQHKYQNQTQASKTAAQIVQAQRSKSKRFSRLNIPTSQLPQQAQQQIQGGGTPSHQNEQLNLQPAQQQQRIQPQQNMVKPARRGSSLVTAFTKVNQKMELDLNKQQPGTVMELKPLGIDRHNIVYHAKKPKHLKQKHAHSGSKEQQQEEKEKAMQAQVMDDHRIELEDLRVRLETDWEKGLTDQQFNDRATEYGLNKMSDPEKEHWIITFLKEITNIFALLLWFAAALCIAAYIIYPDDPSNIYLGCILILIVLAIGIVTYQQNAKSEAIMEGFKNYLPQQCTVIRNGKQRQILASDLVCGDIVDVKFGEKIPADIRILQSREMKVDNSALTGEAEPQLRQVECTHPQNFLETKNMAFFGTMCKEGAGRGVVVRVGDNTMLGQIADMASSEEAPPTPLRIEIDRFIKILTVIAFILGIVFFLIGWLAMGYNVIDCVIFGIGILVANVPEGLLGTITVALALTAKKLGGKYVVVKNLEAVETLGSTSCICSDKTGTLTQNKMTVEHLYYGGNAIRAENMEQYGPNHLYEYEPQDPCFDMLHKCAIISSEARFDIPDNVKDEDICFRTANVIGDATETALVRFFQPINDIIETRQQYQIAKQPDGALCQLPFNSANKFALSIVEMPNQDSEYCIMIKGGSEKIWGFCSQILLQGGKIEQITENNWEKKFEKQNLTFAKGGERVLGFAIRYLPRSQYPKGFAFNVASPLTFNFPLSDFTFVGLISLIDPPKESVPFAVLKCKSAGIKVIMVTGDQPPTAAAIAKQVNIIPHDMKTIQDIMEEENLTWDQAFPKAKAIVVHGDQITRSFEKERQNGANEENEDRQLVEWVKKPYCVFARTSPAQKLRIVNACQKNGAIVAVTGDGVNDSPAIKQGDIGISMGISGSDVTKDAADMILLNDDFASIVDGVEEGRKIFDNLKKTIVYILVSNVIEIVPFLAFVVLLLPLPLSAIFMLCIDLGTDLAPSLSLAYEDAEADIMIRPPRKKAEHLVSARLLMNAYGIIGWFETAAGFIAYFAAMYYYGFRYQGLIGMSQYTAYQMPVDGDVYNDDLPNLGNSNLGSSDFYNFDCRNTENAEEMVDWLSLKHAHIDLRLVFVECVEKDVQDLGSRWVFRPINEWPDHDCLAGNDQSTVTETRICYSTEALKYAQSSYFVSAVFGQFHNIYAVKTIYSSAFHSKFNPNMLMGQIIEILVSIFLMYVPGVNEVFGGRQLSIFMYLTPGDPWGPLLFIWEETRKFCIRRAKKGLPSGKLSWFDLNVRW